MRRVLFSIGWPSSRCGLICALAGFLTLPSGVALAAQLELRPVSATGGYSILGDQITMQAGQTVTLEVFVSGWSPAKLNLYQFRVLSSGYTSGSAGSLTPVGWPGSPATGAFINTSRADYVFFGINLVEAVDTSTLNYLYGAIATANSRSDPGSPQYCGTLELTLSPNAAGTFTVALDPGSSTFLADQNSVAIPFSLTPATIVVGSRAALTTTPVSATGQYSIIGNQITMQAGHSVTLEVYVSGWGPAKLGAYQFRVLSAGYTSGSAGSLTPVGWPGSPSSGAFITTGRGDYVFSGVSSLPAVDTTTLNYRYGSSVATGDARTDPATAKYCATLVLNLSPDAAGTFTVNLDSNPSQTFLLDDSSGSITPIALTPTTIVVEPPAALAVTPVLATGEYSIVGNQISVHPGASVTLEVKASAWGPSSLRAFQFQIDSTGYSSGTLGTLTPAGYPASPADGAFITQTRTDYVFFGQTANTTTYTTTLDYRYGGSLVPPGGVPDLGGHLYAATLVLNVPPDAAGVFTVGLNPNPAQTFLTDSGSQPIVPLVLSPALIRVIVPDCNHNGIPDSVDIANGTSADCNGNGIPDECDIGPQATGKKVYWIKDSFTNAIQRSNLDGTLVQNLEDVSSSLVWGFAIDSIAGKLYWTDPFDDRVYRANLDGTARITLIALSPGSFAAGLALDLPAEKIYWGELSNGIIRRANLDGTGIEDVVVAGITHPVGVALDVVAKKIYWTDDGQPTSIKRANQDGTGVETLVTSGLGSPEGLALDTVFKKIYWTDRSYHVIRRANTDGTQVEDLVTSGLVCPQGIAVDPTGGKMYWADICVGRDVIQRANLNGTGVEVLCYTPSPMAIALDLTQPDCNGNGIPDDCDLASCNSDPGCRDCNLNGLLDECDIATGVSLDVNPHNGIPDECVENVSPSGNWSDNIWGLSGVNPGHPYPDNLTAVPSRRVNMDATTVSLNVSAEIDGLRLTNGAQLTATQSGAQGDLTFAFPGEVVSEAKILVDHRRIGEPVGGALRPNFVIGPSGEYVATGTEAAPSASLFTTDLTIQRGTCLPFRLGGEMTLSGTMSVDVSGNFFMDGRPALNFCPPLTVARMGGVTPPPRLHLIDHSTMKIDGSWVLAGNVAISASGAAAIALSGSVVNQSTVSRNFDFLGGSLSLNGAITRTFEIAGIDYGATTQGFYTSSVGTNYSMGTLELAPGAYVEFVNRFPNTAPLAPCAEALYVRRLVFGAGSTVVIDNCNVYYQSLEANGVTPTFIGACAGLRPVYIPESLMADPSGGNKNRSLAMSVPAAVTAGGVNKALRVTLSSLHHVNPPYTGGMSVPFTSLEGQVLWVGPPAQYVESTSSGIPFYAAALQCTPHYRDWSTVGLFFVTGPEVVPSSIYNVQVIDEGTDISNPASFSLPTAFATGRWGDVESPYNPPGTGPQPDTSDISALVNKFKSALGAPIKARAVLAGTNARGNINLTSDVDFTHISACVDAFKGLPYPYKPGKCKGGLRACTVDLDCTGSSCAGGTNDGAACNPGACAGGGVCTPNAPPCGLCP